MDSVRSESKSFTDGLVFSGIFAKVDVNFAHVYTVANWTGPYEVTEWIDWLQAKLPALPLIITEASWHTPNRAVVPGIEYAAKLNQLMVLLDARPTVGVTFFVADASDPTFRHECWVISQNPNSPYNNGQGRGIATEMRRLRP
jgi:hypothetical protein